MSVFIVWSLDIPTVVDSYNCTDVIVNTMKCNFFDVLTALDG